MRPRSAGPDPRPTSPLWRGELLPVAPSPRAGRSPVPRDAFAGQPVREQRPLRARRLRGRIWLVDRDVHGFSPRERRRRRLRHHLDPVLQRRPPPALRRSTLRDDVQRGERRSSRGGVRDLSEPCVVRVRPARGARHADVRMPVGLADALDLRLRVSGGALLRARRALPRARRRPRRDLHRERRLPQRCVRSARRRASRALRRARLRHGAVRRWR